MQCEIIPQISLVQDQSRVLSQIILCNYGIIEAGDVISAIIDHSPSKTIYLILRIHRRARMREKGRPHIQVTISAGFRVGSHCVTVDKITFEYLEASSQPGAYSSDLLE